MIDKIKKKLTGLNDNKTWHKIKKSFQNIYIRYTVIFIIFFCFVFSPFFVYGKSYLWIPDGVSQHYPTLLYTKEWVGNIVSSVFQNGIPEIPFWTLKMGFGQDVIGNVINFRLFNLLFYFFDETNIEFYLFFRSFLSLYLSGLSFIYFASTKSKHRDAILLGCMTYLFSGFSLYFSARHTFFLEMMFYFPLMLVGVDRIFEKKKSALFVFIVFISCTSYIYFLYMITLPAVIYALFKYFETRDKTRRTIKDFWGVLRCFIWQFLIGVLLSSFSLIPSLIRSFSSSRTSVESGLSLFHWDLEYYFNFIKGFINMDEIGIYGFIAFSGIVIFCVLYMFFEKRKNNNLYLGQFIVYTVTFMFPVLVLAFSGFVGRTQRWCYIYVFWASMILVIMLPRILERKRIIFIKSMLCITAYMIIYTIISKITYSQLQSGIIWLFFYSTLLLLINFSNVFDNKKQIYMILIVMLGIETTMKSYELFKPTQGNYISTFVNTGKVIDFGRNNPSTALQLIDDDSVYRIDSVLAPLGKKYDQKNYGLRNNVNGLSSYYSFSEGNITNFSLELGNSQQNVPFLILDWDQRAALNALSGVKYLAVTDSSKFRVPYGYKFVGKQRKYYSEGNSEFEYLYENEFALPLMYTYDSYISYDDYKEMEANEKEQSMLQGIVLKEKIDYPKTKVDFNYKALLEKDEIISRLKDDYANSETFEVHEDYFIVKDDGVKITLTVDKKNIKGEIYWMMNGATYESKNIHEGIFSDLKNHGKRYVLQNFSKDYLNWSPNTVTTIVASLGSKNDTGTLLNNTYQYYFGKRDLLLNIGYTQSDNITLKFNKAGIYTFDDLKLIAQPMDQFDKQIDHLKEIPVTDIELISNGIKGKIDTKEKQMVQISIPYAKGWSAYVNGNETHVYEANGMYMGIMVPAGKSEIVLQYETPGFILGMKISMISFFSLFVYFIFNKRKLIINKLKTLVD